MWRDPLAIAEDKSQPTLTWMGVGARYGELWLLR
jgi:hypothetical protein